MCLLSQAHYRSLNFQSRELGASSVAKKMVPFKTNFNKIISQYNKEARKLEVGINQMYDGVLALRLAIEALGKPLHLSRPQFPPLVNWEG